MKQVKVAILLSLFIFSATSPAVAQKGRIKQARPTLNQEMVIFAGADALTDGNGVLVRWRTEKEFNNLGFLVYRIGGGQKQLVRENMTLGSATRVRDHAIYGEEYSVFDAAGNATDQYIVESVQLNGKRLLIGPFFPNFVDDIARFAGKTSAEMLADSTQKNHDITSAGPMISKELQTEMDGHAVVPDPVMQRWVAAQPGAKIGIRQEGIYRVMRAELQTAGFDVNSDTTLWQLYSDGVQQAIVVGPNGDYIEFFGRGIDTIESDVRAYFLVVGTAAGKRMRNVAIRPSLGTVTTPNYEHRVEKRERSSYDNTILNGEAENYWGRIIFPFPATINVNIPAPDTTVASARIIVKFQGVSPTSHAINVALNGHSIAQATGTGGIQSFSLDAVIPASHLVDGVNALQLNNTDSSDFSYFDSVEVIYKRRFAADQNKIAFVTQNYRRAIVGGFSSPNVRLFDITYDGDVAQVTGFTAVPNGPAFDVTIPAFRSRMYYAVENTATQPAITVVPNTPSTLSTTTNNANLVVITYKDFVTQANAWADYRRGQGFTVKVVDVEDVYDEFNYGVSNAASLTSFLSYAKNNWQTPPGYVLLIGDGSYDPRNYEGNGNWNMVPARIVNTIFSETASDDSIVDFNGDGLAEIAIGRVPARTGAMVTTALNKTMLFETAPMQSLSRGTLCAFDVAPDWDFWAACDRLRLQLPAGSPFVFVGETDPDAHNVLMAQMNQGKYLVNFAGHGTLGAWISTGFFSNSHVPLLTNQNAPSIYTMLTCLNGFFHEITRVSLAENLVFANNGGAAVAWASSGLTTPNHQEVMGQRFYQQIGLGNMTRMGDLVIDAKSVVQGGRDVRDTWVLIGDPMLKVR